jgi:hypothetical protein
MAGAGSLSTEQASDDPNTKTWRYVTGAFQVKIPVTTEDMPLGPEENTLAIMKARLAALPSQEAQG